MKQLRSIIYVNYSPYENSGKILDYILENFTHVFVISLGFHQLRNKKNDNTLTIYTNGKKEKEFFFFRLSVHPRFVFLLIPIRSIITIFQIVLLSLFLKIKFGTIDIYFSVNAFTAWIGNILRAMGVVKKTIFWVWDYYPPIHKSKIITLMRSIYWQFDQWAIESSKVVFVNQRLLDLRKSMGLIAPHITYPIIPIGTEIIKIAIVSKTKNQPVFGFIGVLKKSHGFGIVFDHAAQLLREFPTLRYEIIGSGPDEEYFKKKALKSKIPTQFYGYMEGESFNDVLRMCTIGIATYIPDPSNVSPFGDPGKIKRYISLGIPVIVTNVIEFAGMIDKTKSGVVIDYNNPDEFVPAVRKILANYDIYQKNALMLAQSFYYRRLYKRFPLNFFSNKSHS